MWHKNLILKFYSGPGALRETRVSLDKNVFFFLINPKERYKYSDFYKKYDRKT